MERLKEILDREGCSLVIRSQGKEQCYWKRGVADLFHLLHNEPDELREAQIADKKQKNQTTPKVRSFDVWTSR